MEFILLFTPIIISIIVTLWARTMWYKTLGRRGLSFIDSILANVIIFCVISFMLLFTKSGDFNMYIGFMLYSEAFVLIIGIGSIAASIVKRKITEDQWVIYQAQSRRKDIKKRRFVLFLISFALFLSYGYTSYQKYGTEYYAWHVNWGIDIPKAAKSQVVYSNVGGFPMDGFTYSFLEYKEKDWYKVKQLTFWNKMSEETYDKFCKDFSWTLNGMYNEDDKKDYERYLKFKEYPLGFGPSTLYFYKTKNDGYESIFAFLNEKERRIYILENK